MMVRNGMHFINLWFFLIPTLLFPQKAFLSINYNNIAQAGEPIIGKQFTPGIQTGVFILPNTSVTAGYNLNSFWYAGLRQYVGQKHGFGEILTNSTHLGVAGGYSIKIINSLRFEPRMMYQFPYHKEHEILNIQLGLTYYFQ